MVHWLRFSVLRLLAIIVTALALAACSTSRQRVGQEEHDIMENFTAKFNTVYHGRKIIADVEQSNFEAHQDNYQQLLPVLIEPNDATASANTALMDSVIGKALHIINRKTRSKYIDEAYLLTGKANYLKGNYYNAAEFFTYLANAFSDDPTYRQAALVWKARALMQLGNLTEAGLTLDTVFTALESEKQSVGLAFAAQAQHYLLMHDEESAITMLQQAIKNSYDRPIKMRWHYLLGQLLQQQGRSQEAYAHYSRVVRSNVPYEMSFHAGLNRVFLATSENPTGADRIRLLRKMLRDGKNATFRDQIHYQIAEVFYAYGDTPEALEHYELALRKSGNNRYQTALTYLKLADHHFGQADYQVAKHYYDSVGMSLPVDFPNAGAIQRKIANLDELIVQLQVVAHQDSLQYLARLDETQRQVELDSIVARAYSSIQKTKINLTKKTAKPSSVQRSPFDEMPGSATTYTDNRFYFNNPDAMGMGQAEFKRRWGNRSLRDNWRFSDMAGGAAVAGTKTETADEPMGNVESATLDSATWASAYRDTLLARLPDTEAKLAVSHAHIRSALTYIGNTYRDELRDTKAAIATYEELLKRYPAIEDRALLYYNLYRLYEGVDDSRRASYHDKLLGEFPDAVYSHIIRDPMYLIKQEQQKRILDQAYEKIYTQYTQNHYAAVIDEVNALLRRGEGRIQTLSQLAYLRVLALGRTSSLDTLERELHQLTTDFPEDSLITPLARQHLTFIEANRDTLLTRSQALYVIDDSRERFVDEPAITPWPQLVINRGPEPARPRRELHVAAAGQTGVRETSRLGTTSGVARQQLAKTADVGELGPNVYRNIELLPDSATYYFVINVMNERVNLAPSRFGIGQFNRTRYNGAAIAHQLKTVNGESQLIYVGPFRTYDEARLYETRILPLLPDIMKIPADIFNTFVVTETIFGTLSDFDKIDDYHSVYQDETSR